MSEIPSDPAGVAKLSWLEDIFSYLYQFRRDGNMLSVVLFCLLVFLDLCVCRTCPTLLSSSINGPEHGSTLKSLIDGQS